MLVRPGVALNFPRIWCSQISRQSDHEGAKIFSNMHRPILPTPLEIFLILISLTGWVEPRDIARAEEEVCEWKISLIPLGTERTTFWLVAQCLHRLQPRVSSDRNVARQVLEGFLGRGFVLIVVLSICLLILIGGTLVHCCKYFFCSIDLKSILTFFCN